MKLPQGEPQLELLPAATAGLTNGSDEVVRSSAIGTASELRAAARLMDLGVCVARPFVDDEGIDLIVYSPKLLTVQVKSSAVQWINGLRTQHRFHVFGSPKQRWQADVFLFHGRGDPQIEDTWWVIPGEALRADGVARALSLYPGARGRSERFARYIESWDIFL